GIRDFHVTGVQTCALPIFEAAKQVYQIVRKGSLLQYSTSKVVTVAGRELLLYGRLDALRAGTIYDIKFSRSYERGKYYSSTQHQIGRASCRERVQRCREGV